MAFRYDPQSGQIECDTAAEVLALAAEHAMGRSNGQSGGEPEDKRNPAAVALGRRGGLKGGKARSKSLSWERRSEIAKLAARARWKARDAANPRVEVGVEAVR